MTVEHGAVPVIPRWLSALWLWVPAGGALLLFAGAGVLRSADGATKWWWAVTAVGVAGAYAARDRAPLVALACVLALLGAVRLPGVAVITDQFDVVFLLLLFVPVLPLVVVASRAPVRWSWLALAATIVVGAAVSPTPPWRIDTATAQGAVVQYVLNVGVPAMISVAGWLAGYALLVRQRYADALLARAVSLERTREAETTRAVAEERTRIARELHDVITHSVAVMVVQAAAAEAVWERDPAQARASLAAVQESGRTVMSDLRGVLRAMRSEEPAERQAQPGLEDLGGLVDQVRRTGIDAELTVTGNAAVVTPLTALSLLRIAQESVTNALRHAHASLITISLGVDTETVHLAVRDDGVGLHATRESGDGLDPDGYGGHGLLGMQERAHAIGAALSVTVPDGGGTLVTVHAPLRQDAFV